jgi:N-acetylneuraminate synthase
LEFSELLEINDVVVIAEIGINHEGSLDTAQKLIIAAHESGADAVKFQYRDLTNIYLNKNEIGDEILFAEINRNFLTVEQILNLTKSAKDLGLFVGISFFHELDIKNFGNEIKIFDFFKIPSAEISNFILINNLINLGKYLLISTGTANENTINSSFSKIKTNKWMPLHCISNYPTASYNSQLGYINYLKNKWNRPVGYSSHDSNWAVICAALMLGVKVVERHITLDKKSSGLDHTSSSTPDEFKLIKDFARNIDKLLMGENERIPNQGELLNLQNLLLML